MCQLEIAGVQMSERKKRDDALGHAVGVDRIGAVMVVLDRSVLAKEVIAVERKPSPNGRVKFRCPSAHSNALQGTEIETCVEVVDPAL
jgi:hypothetical protein